MNVPINLDDLYRQKGELVTQLEVAQGRLQIINQQIQAVFNQGASTPGTAPIK